MKKSLINKVKIDKKLDELPNTPIFKKKYEEAKIFLANLNFTDEKVCYSKQQKLS